MYDLNFCLILYLQEKLISQVIGALPDPTPLQISAMTELVEDIYSRHSSQANNQDAIRRGIVEHLSTLVKPVWGEEVVVEMFGSSRMSVALDTSDVNININIEDTDISQVRYNTRVHNRTVFCM